MMRGFVLFGDFGVTWGVFCFLFGGVIVFLFGREGVMGFRVLEFHSSIPMTGFGWCFVFLHYSHLPIFACTSGQL